MLLLEEVAVGLPELHHRAHVHVVERGEHGGVVLRLLEAARDGLAEPRHAHALLARLVAGRGGRARRCAGAGAGRRFGGASAALRAHRPSAPGRACRCPRRRRRRRPSPPSAFVRTGRAASSVPARPLRGGVGCVAGAARGASAAARRRLRPACGCGCLRTGIDRRGLARPRLPRASPSSAPTPTVSPSFTAIFSSRPAAGAGTSSVTLSVSSSTSGSSRATASPSLLEPLADGRLRHGFAERRDFDFERHSFFQSR